MSLSVSCQRVKRLLHRSEEGIQINMENTPSHETVYNLARRADNANNSELCVISIHLTIVIDVNSHLVNVLPLTLVAYYHYG